MKVNDQIKTARTETFGQRPYAFPRQKRDDVIQARSQCQKLVGGFFGQERDRGVRLVSFQSRGDSRGERHVAQRRETNDLYLRF